MRARERPRNAGPQKPVQEARHQRASLTKSDGHDDESISVSEPLVDPTVDGRLQAQKPFISGLESGFAVVAVTAHTKVTSIAHGVSGAGQVWYRVTGSTGIATAQVAYRVGAQEEAVRRVRFVGAGATATLLRFRPGQLVTSEADLEAIEAAFSGGYLSRGVKTQRSRLARVPAAPVRDVVVAALASAGVSPDAVFVSRDAQSWWRSVSNAATRGRSVSFLTADGVLRAAARAGGDVRADDLHAAVGAWCRDALSEPVDVRARDHGVMVLPGLEFDDLTDDVTWGERAWSVARLAASRHEVVGNAGYELTLTLPKSFSLYALSGDPALSGPWFEVMEAAATRALERLMDEAGFCSTGHRGDGDDVQVMTADGWAGFIATELSSRAGDPHLHVHCTLPNVLAGRDGVVRTMADGGRELIINAPRFAAWGQVFVIDEALRRGLIADPWFNPATAQWEVGAFSDTTLEVFSRGRRAVIDEQDDSADGSARDRRGRTSLARSAKRRATIAKDADQPTWDQLHASVQHRATAHDIDLDTELWTNGGAYVRQPGEWSDVEWVDWVAGMTCVHDSTTSLAQIRALVDLTGALLPADERDRITALVLDGGFTRGHASRDTGMKTGGQRWISTAALHAEQRLLDLFAVGPSSPTEQLATRATTMATAAFAARQGWQLSDEQVQAVTAIVDGTDAITLISGVGGSGKTSVLAAANHALTSQRRGMLVTSTATIAASAAGDASGAPWMNLTALRQAIWRQQPIDAKVIVVDEASMADVQSIADVADWCAQTGCRLILQGDHRQLRAVGAGDAYNTLCTEHPERVIRLSTNQRQRTLEGRAIADALHARDLDTAWQVITDTQGIVVARNREHKLTVLAAAVADHVSELGADQVTCDAVTNAEVNDLNQRIHDRLIRIGTINPGSVVTYRSGNRERQLGPGTILRVTRPTGPSAKQEARLVRGERASITTATREQVTVRFDDGRTRALTPRTVLAHLDYGYAGTTHKVQGQTSAVHIASLGPAKDLASMYVSATRGRDRTLFVVDARDYLTDTELVRTQSWKPADLDDEVLDRVKSALAKRSDRIDSPREHMRPAVRPVGPTRSPGFGISG